MSISNGTYYIQASLERSVLQFDDGEEQHNLTTWGFSEGNQQQVSFLRCFDDDRRLQSLSSQLS
jgi:hypothetical protein